MHDPPTRTITHCFGVAVRKATVESGHDTPWLKSTLCVISWRIVEVYTSVGNKVGESMFNIIGGFSMIRVQSSFCKCKVMNMMVQILFHFKVKTIDVLRCYHSLTVLHPKSRHVVVWWFRHVISDPLVIRWLDARVLDKFLV